MIIIKQSAKCEFKFTKIKKVCFNFQKVNCVYQHLVEIV